MLGLLYIAISMAKVDVGPTHFSKGNGEQTLFVTPIFSGKQWQEAVSLVNKGADVDADLKKSREYTDALGVHVNKRTKHKVGDFSITGFVRQQALVVLRLLVSGKSYKCVLGRQVKNPKHVREADLKHLFDCYTAVQSGNLDKSLRACKTTSSNVKTDSPEFQELVTPVLREAQLTDTQRQDLTPNPAKEVDVRSVFAFNESFWKMIGGHSSFRSTYLRLLEERHKDEARYGYFTGSEEEKTKQLAAHNDRAKQLLGKVIEIYVASFADFLKSGKGQESLDKAYKGIITAYGEAHDGTMGGVHKDSKLPKKLNYAGSKNEEPVADKPVFLELV